MDEKNRNNLLNMQLYIDYIKAIENPDKIGWNGKVWIAPQYKGYDKNQRGYGIDIVKNDTAKRLTQNRPGQWLTEEEADKLMKEHLLYVYGAALKHIEGFDNLSDRRKAVLLGMLYRGDSVNKNRHIIDINEPDDNKFFESINNYYKSKGLNERAKNSSNFFNNQTNFLIPMKWEQWEPPMKFKSGGQVRKMQTAAGGPLFPWLKLDDKWINNWKFRTTPAARSKVLYGKGVETDKQYTERRKKETTKRTWRSDVADIAHGVGEGVLALHPYTAIPYFGALVGQDFLNGNYGWQTALKASVPLFHLSPLINNGINILNKNTSKVPLKSLSLSKFVNPDNTININNSVEAIKEGKNWAVLYLQSEAKKQTNLHNLLLAQKIGLKLFRPFNEASLRAAVPNKIKIINERGNMEGGSVWTDSKNPALDETTINVSQNPYYSSLHENLHRGYVGNAPKEYYLNEPRGTFGDTNKFYEWLKEKTLKPWSERHNLPGAEYLDKPEELAVNLIEAGLRMGLKIGLLYPGKLKALELMEKYRLSGDYKSGVIDLLNLKKPKRAWKGLTGTLFSLPFIYGYNSNGLKNIQ